VRWRDWQPLYKEILADFGYDPEGDTNAALELARALRKRDHDPGAGPTRLSGLIDGSLVCVVGAAMEPSVFEPGPQAVTIAADGATVGLLEAGVCPDIVVTDLDGPEEALIRAAEMGARFVIHAHGDNHDRLEEGVRHLSPVMGTCQCEPIDGLFNFGGFTDGDRAVYLAASLGASGIELAGFDFDEPGLYSHHRDPILKLAKLQWARRLIELVPGFHEVPVLGR